MTTQAPDDPEREKRVDQIIAAYLQAEQEGKAEEPAELTRRHPDLAAELQSFFDGLVEFRRLAEPIAPAASAPHGAPAAGTVHYFGDYELLEEIASGGMGVVYKARQVSLNRILALKMILAGELATPEEMQRFRREARAVANCDHPGIVPIYEVGEHAGRQYFTMKLIPGHNLAHDLAHFRKNLRAAAHLLAQVAHAVQHAHERGLLHRDLKPANILLDAAKRPHVTDFGLAAHVQGSGTLSRTGQIIGTACYMSPEQAAAQHRQLSAATDIYSLGAILYEVLTGRPPFRGTTVVDTLRQVVEREPARPRTLDRAVPPDLETICLQCMDRRPQRRYASAAALAADLENWVGGRPIKARPVGRMERAWLWCRRQPLVVGLAAAAALLAVALGSGLAILSFAVSNQAKIKADEENVKLIAAAKQKAEADRKAREAEDNAKAEKKRQEALEKAANYNKDMRRAGGLAQGQDYPALAELLARYETLPGEPDHRQWEWYYLRALAVRDSLIAPEKADADSAEEWYYTLPGNGKAVVCLTWSPDGRRLAAYNDAGWLRVLELPTGKILFTQKVDSPAANIYRLQSRLDPWSPDGTRLALSIPGRPLDFKGEKTEAPRELHELDGVKIIDVATGKPLAELPLMAGKLPNYPTAGTRYRGYRAITWSPDGRLIAANNGDPQVPVYDGRTGEEVKSLAGHTGAVLAVAWSADGAKLASGGADNTVIVWDVHAGKAEYTLRGEGPVIALAWRPDGRRLLTSRVGKGCALWDTDKRQVVWTAPTVAHANELAWSRDGARLRLGPQVLDAASGRVVFQYSPYRGAAPDFATRDLHRAAQQEMNENNGTLRTAVLALPGSHPECLLAPWLSTAHNLALPYDGTVCGAWSPDGTTLALANSKGRLHIHHLPGDSMAGAQKPCAPAPRERKTYRTLVLRKARELVWDADNRHFTIDQIYQGSLPLEPVDPERLLTGVGGVLRDPAGLAESRCMELSPDGKVLAAALNSNEIQLWDAHTGKPRLRLAGHHRFSTLPTVNSGPIEGLLWSPRGKYLASCRAQDGTVKVWDVATGAEVFSIDLGISRVGWTPPLAWVWSPDETQLAISARVSPAFATGLHSGETTIWEVATGMRKRTLTSEVFGRLAWSFDSGLLACARADVPGVHVQLWDPLTGKKVDELRDAMPVVGAMPCMAWDPMNPRLAWAIRGGGSVYDCKTQKVVPFKLPANTTYEHLVWQPDGEKLAVTNGRDVVVVEADSGAAVSVVRGKSPSFAWPPDRLVTVETRTDVQQRTPYDVRQRTSIAVRNTTSGATVVIQLDSSGPPPPVIPAFEAPRPKLWNPERTYSAEVRGDPLRSPNMVVAVADKAGTTLHEFVGDARQFGVLLQDVLAWSPDGRLLAAGGSTVRIWDVAAHRQVHCLQGHAGVVESMVWSPDGKRILARTKAGVTGTDDWELKIWDTASGREVLQLRGDVAELRFNGNLTACSLVQATGFNDFALVVWDLTGAAGLPQK